MTKNWGLIKFLLIKCLFNKSATLTFLPPKFFRESCYMAIALKKKNRLVLQAYKHLLFGENITCRRKLQVELCGVYVKAWGQGAGSFLSLVVLGVRSDHLDEVLMRSMYLASLSDVSPSSRVTFASP